MKQIFLILLILIINTVCAPAFSQAPSVMSESSQYCYKGDKILNYYEKLSDKSNSVKYLSSAKYFYYQANRVDMSNQNAYVGRARICLHEDNTKDAKNNLMMAMNFNEKNPKVSFYLGETYFKEGEYTQAIFFYNRAYKLGYKYDYRTNLMLGICYEKMDDVENAKTHYKNAIKIKPHEVEPQTRLQGMNAVNTNYDAVKTEEESEE